MGIGPIGQGLRLRGRGPWVAAAAAVAVGRAWGVPVLLLILLIYSSACSAVLQACSLGCSWCCSSEVREREISFNFSVG